MKRILTLFLAIIAVPACDNSPSESDARRYDLVEFFGRPLPVSLALDVPGIPGQNCLDTLYAGFIELATGSAAARRLHQHVRNCGGQRTLVNNERTGTYVLTADTVRLTWNVGNDLIATLSESAVLQSNQLRFGYPVYTEADPNGAQIAYIVYQRR